MMIFRRRANNSEMYLDLAVASRLRFCLSWCFSSCSGLNTPVVKKKKKKKKKTEHKKPGDLREFTRINRPLEPSLCTSRSVVESEIDLGHGER
jgi:hypothetical protein